MEKIIINDDFLSLKNMKNLKECLINNKEWINNIEESNSRMFKKHDAPFWVKDLRKDIFLSIYMTEKISSYYNKNFELKRVYIVGQMYGQNSNFHTDDKREDRYTFLLYLKDNYMDNDEGYIYFKIPNENYILTIEPKNNRGVLFPSGYIHKGSGYNKLNTNLRTCIAWKLKEIK
jgi:hypothetical protein